MPEAEIFNVAIFRILMVVDNQLVFPLRSYGWSHILRLCSI